MVSYIFEFNMISPFLYFTFITFGSHKTNFDVSTLAKIWGMLYTYIYFSLMLFLLDKSSRCTIHDNISRFTPTTCKQYYVKMIVLFNCRQVFSNIFCAPMCLFNKFLHCCLVWNVCHVPKWNLCLIQFATVFLQLSD